MVSPEDDCVILCACNHLALSCILNVDMSVCSRRDLSRNHISSLDTSLLDRLTGLRELWVCNAFKYSYTVSTHLSVSLLIYVTIYLSFRYLQGNMIKVLPRGVFCCGPLSILWVQSQEQMRTFANPRSRVEEDEEDEKKSSREKGLV